MNEGCNNCFDVGAVKVEYPKRGKYVNNKLLNKRLNFPYKMGSPMCIPWEQ
jgi:hypothetical protein